MSKDACAFMLLLLCTCSQAHAFFQVRQRPAKGAGDTFPHKLDAWGWINKAREDMAGVHVSSNCEADFGQPYIDKWKNNKIDYCSSSNPQGSSIQCYNHPDRTSETMMTCLHKNMVFDSQGFMQGPNRGSVKVGCQVKTPSMHINDRVASRWFKAVEAVPESDVERICNDPSNVVDHPVYFLDRWDSTNRFHNGEDEVTLMVVLAILELPDIMTKGLEIVITDTSAPGYYLSVWRRLALPWKLRILSEDPFPPNTCFTQAFTNPFAIASLYTYRGVGVRHTCPSVIMRAYRAWVKNLFPELLPDRMNTAPVQNEGVEHKKVLFLSRKNFEKKNKHRLTGWQQARVLDDTAIIMALQQATLDWNNQACFRQRRKMLGSCRDSNVVFDFITLELSDTPFMPDQLFQLSRTNILVAVHGAGLANMMFMPENDGSVLEISHTRSGNFHYEILANMYGYIYRDVPSPEGNAIGNAVKGLMDELSKPRS